MVHKEFSMYEAGKYETFYIYIARRKFHSSPQSSSRQMTELTEDQSSVINDAL